MNIKLQLAFFVFTGLVILMGIFWSIKTEMRLKKFFMGKKAKDLEDLIVSLEDDLKKLNKEKQEIKLEIIEINKKLKKSIRGLEVVRFNPFSGQGSNQSFAIGMLNEDKDGVVISTLYSRERMSVFAKPIKNGKSDFELTNEEKDALEKATV